MGALSLCGAVDAANGVQLSAATGSLYPLITINAITSAIGWCNDCRCISTYKSYKGARTWTSSIIVGNDHIPFHLCSVVVNHIAALSTCIQGNQAKENAEKAYE